MRQLNQIVGTLVFCGCSLIAAAAQEKRPPNVPFYTWVREDTFAGFLDNDLQRFEVGVRKAREYLAEDPSRPDANI